MDAHELLKIAEELVAVAKRVVEATWQERSTIAVPGSAVTLLQAPWAPTTGTGLVPPWAYLRTFYNEIESAKRNEPQALASLPGSIAKVESRLRA
jgi:hypothetical protein